MAFTADMLARLEAQRAYFASDEHIKERAAAWRDATPEQCLTATAEECETALRMLERLDPDTLRRALAPVPLPADTEALLERLWAARRHR